MKKTWALLLALVLCAAVLAGCGGGESGKKDEGGIKGKMHDAGNVQAFVPEGWLLIPVADMWSDEEDAVDPDAMQICKGGKSEWDILTHPYIQINHYPEEDYMLTPDKTWYDEGKDIEPMKLGELTWEGFTAKSLGYSIAVLWAGEEDEHQYQITMYTETEDHGSISLEDADVKAIIESIKPSK